MTTWNYEKSDDVKVKFGLQSEIGELNHLAKKDLSFKLIIEVRIETL